MGDELARGLIDRAQRIAIYRRLNPCNVALADNCPSAAQALFTYLRSGQEVHAYCNDVSEGFIENDEVHYQHASLRGIIAQVSQGAPGNLVVVHARRPINNRINGRRMAPDHYFVLVRLGPPEDDVFWADCSRPEFAILYPSRQHAGFDNTIMGLFTYNQLNSRRCDYTRGPFSVRHESIR